MEIRSGLSLMSRTTVQPAVALSKSPKPNISSDPKREFHSSNLKGNDVNSTAQWRGFVGKAALLLKFQLCSLFCLRFLEVFFFEAKLRDDNVLTRQTHISGSCAGRQHTAAAVCRFRV